MHVVLKIKFSQQIPVLDLRMTAANAGIPKSCDNFGIFLT